MLLYHPYKDSNHCTFRLLSILSKLENEINFDKLKILDFYYLFPHFLSDIDSWPNKLMSYKKYIKNIPEPFEKTPNKKKLFFDLESIQNHAVMQLASKGVISVELLKKGIVKLESKSIPDELAHLLNEAPFNKSDVFKALIEGVYNFPWNGVKGLKMRSGLMEYKYDE